MSYKSKLPSGTEVEFALSDGTFKPTYTSELFIQALAKIPKKPYVTVDLGCGCGIVGIMAAKMGLVQGKLNASDLSKEAVELTGVNAKKHSVPIESRVGALLEPWKGMKFDLIIDDISGITEDVAKLSPWYAQNIPCATGPDGTELTVEVLRQAPGFLNPGGTLLIPVISLSATDKILQAAKSHFSTIEKMASQSWMLPPEMTAFREELRRIKGERRVHFDEKFGMMLCWTEVYRCMI